MKEAVRVQFFHCCLTGGNFVWGQNVCCRCVYAHIVVYVTKSGKNAAREEEMQNNISGDKM